MRVLEIARLYLSIMYRSRAMLIFGFILPMIFTGVVGAAIGDGGGGTASTKTPIWRIALVNQDEGDLGATVFTQLDENKFITPQDMPLSTAERAIEAEKISGVLVLPNNFSAALAAGQSIEVDFYINLGDPIDAQVVEQAVEATLESVNSAASVAVSSVQVATEIGLFIKEGAPNAEGYYSDALDRAFKIAPFVVVRTETAQGEETTVQIPDGTAQTGPGMVVVFTMFSALAGAAALLREREQGTLRRLLVMPTTKAHIIGGKLLGMFFVSFSQIIILVVGGALLYKIQWGADIFALLVMIVAFSFSIVSLSMMMAALVRSYAQLDAFSTAIVIPLAGLGGAMWPIEIVPQFMQKIALFLPTGWAMRGFHDIVTRGFGAGDIFLEAGVLFAFGLAFLLIALWRFRFE